MEIAVSLLRPGLLPAILGLALLTLLAALWRTPWRAWLSVPARQHLFFATALSLAVLWSIAFSPADGLLLHYLGMSTATLLLGAALAMLAGALALLALAALGLASAEALPLTWLLTAVVPALVVEAELALLRRTRVRNLFVFLLGVGFAGAMLVSLGFVLAALATLALAGQYAMVASAVDHVTLLPLLLFSEGFINGAAVSVLTVYFPHLVRGFDEARFLGEP